MNQLDLSQELAEVLGEPVDDTAWQLMHEDAEWENFLLGTVGAVLQLRDGESRYWIMARRVPEHIQKQAIERDASVVAALLPHWGSSHRLDSTLFWVFEYDLHPSEHSFAGIFLRPGHDFREQLLSAERERFLQAYRDAHIRLMAGRVQPI